MLICKSFNKVGSRDIYKGEFPELEIEGKKELELLCPVSKLTGFPMSMQQAIYMITDKNSRLADMLYQEIPNINASESISDDDKFNLLVSRLDTGSFFENDRAVEILGNVAKEFFPDAKQEIVDKVVNDAQQKINFESGDAPSGDS